MIIGLPVNANNLEEGISASYGRAPFYYIYDSQTKEGHFVDNKAAGDVGGVGVKSAQLIIDQKVEALITPRLGDQAAQVLEGAEIGLYKSQGTDIMENIEAVLASELEKLTEIHPGHHGN
ncbi:MAG: dinitrogenase iron-molybdenum cofactor biosynthesis protein [Tissierellia bacterium]|nr:dinitrogenase iron-molybdenum cofactor biosynthesis protein [Tissierellia bacterium]